MTIDYKFDKCMSGDTESFKLVRANDEAEQKKADAATEKCDTTKLSYEWYKGPNCKNLDVEQTKQYGDFTSRKFSGYDGECYRHHDRSTQATCDAEAMYEHYYGNNKCEGKEDFNIDYQYGKCLSGSESSFKIIKHD